MNMFGKKQSKPGKRLTTIDTKQRVHRCSWHYSFNTLCLKFFMKKQGGKAYQIYIQKNKNKKHDQTQITRKNT